MENSSSESRTNEKMPFSKDVEVEYEERYHNASEENLLLKKTINQQLKLIKKLNASLQWYSRKDSKDDERSPPRDPGKECRLHELETSNKILGNKVKVLKQQLISLSSFQATTKLPSSRGVSPSKESVLSLSSKRPKSTTPSSHPRNQVDAMMSMVMDEKMNGQPLFTIDEDLEGLRGDNHLGVYEGDPGMRPDSAESVCDISNKLLVNVEVIRMKRMMKWQNAQLTTLLTCVDNLNQESQTMKETMSRLSEENNELKNSLSFEKKKYKMLQQNTTNKEQVKVLEEQIRDLQGERNTLRDHNKKLLSLAADYEAQKNEHHKPILKQTRDVECQISCDSSLVKESTTIQFSAPSQPKNQRKHKYNSLSNEEVSVSSKHSKQDISSDLSIAHDHSSSSSVILDTDDGLSGQKLGEPMDTDPVDSASFSDATNTKHPQEKSSGTLRRKKSKLEIKNGPKSLFDSAENVNASSPRKSQTQSVKTVDKDSLNLGNHNDELLQAELAESLCELERCRQMLKIQCNLNTIYKEEVEKLSVQLKKEKEEVHVDGSISAVEVLLKEHLEKIEKFQTAKHLRSHEQQTDFVDIPEKLHVIESKEEIAHRTDNTDETSKFIIKDETLQSAVVNTSAADISSDVANLSASDSKQVESTDHRLTNESIEKKLLPTGGSDVCQLELYVHKLVLSSHSLTPKTQLFLTWGFLDQEEHAYSPVKSVNDLDFSCSCAYKGQCSEELLNYLTMHGVVIEVYQVVGEGCIKIAQATIDTSIAIRSTSTMHSCETPLISQIVAGALHSSFQFVCSCQLMQQFLPQNLMDDQPKETAIENELGNDAI